MSSSEEYLENLLQSMINGETPESSADEKDKPKSAIELLSGGEPESVAEPQPQSQDANKAMSPEEIEAMFAAMGNSDASVDELEEDSTMSEDSGLDNLSDLFAMADMPLSDNEDAIEETPSLDEFESMEETPSLDAGFEEPMEETSGEIVGENIDDDLADLLGMSDMTDMAEDTGLGDTDEEIPDENGEIDTLDSDLADLLGMADMAIEEDNTGESDNDSDAGDIDLSDMADFAIDDGNIDEDMAEINGLLEQSGQEDVDEEMLELLKSLSDSSDQELGEASEDAFHFFNEGAENNEQGEITGDNENIEEIPDKKAKKKKEKKERKAKKERRFGRKKKGEQPEENPETDENNDDAEISGSQDMDGLDLTMMEGFDGVADVPGLASKTDETGKKKGLFAKIIDFLMEADEEEEENEDKNASKTDSLDELLLGETSDENQDILNELNAEDNKAKKEKGKKDKKGKKEKKGKKDKKNKKGQDAQDDEMSEEESEESAKGKKKKRPKKEKKKKENEEAVEEKPTKKVSRKKIIAVVLFCATITVCIVLLSSVIPSYLEKRDAHVAYDLGNYEEVYDLLSGKKLSEEDEIILHKSRIILRMNRKLEAYQSYQKMDNKELEALDALIQGVSLYYELLPAADEYNVSDEIKEVYQEILNILSEQYGLSEADVSDIIASEDNVVYTEHLRSIVFGTIYDDLAGENATDTVEDVLPEEQEIMNGMTE